MFGKKYFLFIFTLVFAINAIPSFALYVSKERENFIPKEFLGKWKMQTIVTESECPYIIVGSTTESNLEIKPTVKTLVKKYLLKAFWKGGEWKDSKGFIKILNEKEAITERVTEMKTKDKNIWKAILIDHLHLKDNNQIHSESIVIQYKNNEMVGEYKTFSILTKIID